MKKLRKNKKGFTLIELIVVVAILAILAAVAVPNFIGMSERALTATEIAAAAEVANAINIQNTLSQSDANIDAIADAAEGELDAPELIDDLTPDIDSVDDPDTYVYPRITVASGIATVTEKDNLH